MSKVIYHTNPVETASNVDFGEWMLSRWPVGSVRPRGLRLYKDDLDITTLWYDDEDLLTDPDATYHLYEVPAGGVVSSVTRFIGAILNPILKLFMPNTSTSASFRNSRSASSNNALQGRTNAPRPGERIADIRGFVRAYPDLLMDYRIFYDGVEYEVQFLCVTTNECEIIDVKDGITPARNISGTQLDFYKSGSAPGYGSPYMNIGGNIDVDRFPIMIAKSSNEADGTEVKPPNYADIKNATFKIYSTGEIDTTVESSNNTTIDWSERAPIGSSIKLTQFYAFNPINTAETRFERVDLSGDYTVVYASNDILIVDTSGQPGWEALPVDGRNAYLEAWDLGSGVWALDNSQGGTRNVFSPSLDSVTPYIVGPYLIQSADKVMVNLYAQNGVYKTDGDIYPFTCDFRVILSDPSGVQASVTHNLSVTGNYTEAVGSTLKVDNPFNGPVNVSVQRITDTDKGFNGSVIDAIKWRDLYAVTDIEPRTYGNLTLTHAVTRATNAALKQKERKLNMLVESMYDGVSTRNFDDVILSMHVDPFIGRRDLTTIDVDALRDVKQQMLDYFGDERAIQCGYTFDNNSMTYEESLNVICNAVNVRPYQIGSVLYFWSELPQEVSAMQFGHAFKIPGTDKRTRSFAPLKNYTGVRVKYYDHDEQSYLYITEGEEVNVSKIDLDACQSKYLATIRAKREFNKLMYQRITHECTTTSVGLQTTPGMRIDMIDNTRIRQMEGVIDDVDGTTLYLSDPCVLDPSNNYSITLTGRLGNIENLQILPGNDEWSVVLLDEPTEEIYTGWLRDKTSFIIRADDMRSSLAMMTQSMEPSGRDNNYQVGLTCINYDARYYKDDV